MTSKSDPSTVLSGRNTSGATRRLRSHLARARKILKILSASAMLGTAAIVSNAAFTFILRLLLALASVAPGFHGGPPPGFHGGPPPRPSRRSSLLAFVAVLLTLAQLGASAPVVPVVWLDTVVLRVSMAVAAMLHLHGRSGYGGRAGGLCPRRRCRFSPTALPQATPTAIAAPTTLTTAITPTPTATGCGTTRALQCATKCVSEIAGHVCQDRSAFREASRPTAEPFRALGRRFRSRRTRRRPTNGQARTQLSLRTSTLVGLITCVHPRPNRSGPSNH